MKRGIRRALWGMALVALLAADAGLTWRLAKGRFTGGAREALSAVAGETQGDPIARFRLEREQLRARQEAELNDIVYSPGTDEGTAAEAREQLLGLMSRAEKELTLEGVLQARGFEDALVTVSDASANVLLRQETVTQRETAVILELVMRETGLTGGNVKIIPVK